MAQPAIRARFAVESRRWFWHHVRHYSHKPTCMADRNQSESRELPALSISAPARLHLGFIDVSGSIGRRFGSLGLALQDLSTILHVERAENLQVEGPGAERARDYLQQLIDEYDPPTALHVRIERAIPEHVGLGSGTQLAFAIGRAFSTLFCMDLDAATISSQLDRGARSGIGIGVFDQGGFVVDGGRAPGGPHPPVIARLPFPQSWRVVLVFDRGERGLHGEAEREAFRRLKAFPQSAAAHLSHLLLMRAMPALVEQDCEAFGHAIGEIQRSVGDYFAMAQGGRFTSTEVAQVLQYLESKDVPGVGQTSWGPTGFAIVDSEVRAHALLADLRNRFSAHSKLEFMVVRGRNAGHESWFPARVRPAVDAVAQRITDERASLNHPRRRGTD